MNVKIKGKVYRTVVRPALVYGEETLALKKAQEIGGRRNMNATIDVRSYETVQDRKWKNMGDDEIGRNCKENPRQFVEVI